MNSSFTRPDAVVLSLTDPWAAATGGTLRTRAALRALRDSGYTTACIFPSDSIACEEPEAGTISLPAVGLPRGSQSRSAWLSRAKRAVLPMPTQWGATSPAISELLGGLDQVEVLVIQALSQVPYRHVVRSRVLWVDFMDLWSDYAERDLSTRPRWAQGLGRLQVEQLRRREAQIIREATFVSVAGWEDGQIARRRTRREPIWLPVPVEFPDTRRKKVGRPGRLTAGFLGNFAHPPNREAVRTLCTTWAPRLIELGWRVVVAGRGSSGLTLPSFVESLGDVRSLPEFYAGIDVSLAPLRLGGGIKVKVVESLVHGVPVVASPFAVDGLRPDLRGSIKIVDLDAPEFSVLDTAWLGQTPDNDLAVFGQAWFTATIRNALEGESKHVPC